MNIEEYAHTAAVELSDILQLFIITFARNSISVRWLKVRKSIFNLRLHRQIY